MNDPATSPPQNSDDPTQPGQTPTRGEALRFWLKLGFISFGGPTGQIAIMHAELVEKRRWIDEPRFLHALNFCMLLPGPEAQQLATYIGWLLHRTWGGIVAGSLFVLPSALLLWIISVVYVMHGDVPWIAAVFDGLKPGVVAIIAAAAVRIGRRTLRSAALWSVGVGAFVAIFALNAPFPLIVSAAAAVGWLGDRVLPGAFRIAGSHGSAESDAPGSATGDVRASWRRTVRVIVTCGALWWLPVGLAALTLGVGHAVVQQGVFFSKAAMVTFGGAYAVLPYVAQQAIDRYGWVTPGQMIDGLALAETTPGPLIMVLQFVGFVGAWQQPGGLSPLAAATLGAAMTTWVTFLPCFLWIFVGAPFVEALRGNARLTAALAAVTAAVVGVIADLALTLASGVFASESGVNWIGVAMAAVALVGMVRWRWPVIAIVLGSAALGVALRALGMQPTG